MNDGIYQEGIKALAIAAHGAGKLDKPDGQATLHNPLCGDQIRLELQLENGCISALAHEVKGCLLCRAAASVIGANAVGSNTDEMATVQRLLTELLQGAMTDTWRLPGWRSLQFFQPVAAHKSRHECVLLPFKALSSALLDIQ